MIKTIVCVIRGINETIYAVIKSHHVHDERCSLVSLEYRKGVTNDYLVIENILDVAILHINIDNIRLLVAWFGTPDIHSNMRFVKKYEIIACQDIPSYRDALRFCKWNEMQNGRDVTSHVCITSRACNSWNKN